MHGATVVLMVDEGAVSSWTVADIARIYGQPLPTIETLRSRDAAFPQPRGRKGRAFLYLPSDVQAWAMKRGWRPQRDINGEGKGTGLSLLPDVYTAARAALGCLHAQGRLNSPLTNPDKAFTALIESGNPWALQVGLSGIAPVLRRALDSVSTEELENLREISEHPDSWGDDVDFVIGAEATDSGRILPTYSSPRLVGWISSLCPTAGGTALDPACGTGLLLSSVARAGNTGDLRLVGMDQDPEAVRVSALRLLAHGQRSELLTGDALDPEGPMLKLRGVCDLVVGDVPTGPSSEWARLETQFGRAPKNEQEFLWLACAFDALKPGGRAVICTPARALESPGRAARMRSNLVERGAVSAVVTLPAGMRPGAAPALALWVLTKHETSTPRPFLTVNAAVIEQHAQNEAKAHQLTSQVVEAFLQDSSPATDLPFGAVRFIEPSEALAASGFNFAPWSPAAQDISPFAAETPVRNMSDALVEASPDLWTELVAVRDEFDTVMTALWERLRDPDQAATSVTLGELLRRNDVLMFEVRMARDTASISRSWTFPTEPEPHHPGRGDRPGVLSERPRSGDVAVTRTEQTGVNVFGAEVIADVADAQDLPAGTRRLLRIRADSPELTPEAIAAAINAVAANGWPKGSRGDLDIERATSYIRVPLSGANEIGLEAALQLRDHLEPLLNRLADPAHWT